MVSWVILAIGAQLLTAVSVVIDRHIVVRAAHIGKPIVYAFYVSLLSGFVIVLLPFGVVLLPAPYLLVLALLHAAAFTTAIYCLYNALSVARASDVAPVVGASSAIVTLLLARLWLDGDAPDHFLLPIFFLVAGTVLISHFHFSRQALIYTLLAGIAFGASVFFAKLVFIETTFLDGFFWTRMMNVTIACSLLLLPSLRIAILSGGARSSQGARLLVIGNKILGGVAAIMTAFAISLGSVSVVNALSGLQFAFLFLFAFIFGRYMPLLKEGGKTHGHGGWQTALGVTIICLGLSLLYSA